jgi:hypothetical protein
MALREAYDTQPAKEAIFPVTTHTKVPLVSSETVTDIFQRTSIKEESRRADSNRLPLLITSDNSCVAGVCTGLQTSHR